MVLYSDDTRIIMTESNPTAFNQLSNSLIHEINTWFRNNLLILNLNKTQYLEFTPQKITNLKDLYFVIIIL
jgi:hypothetical protein